jgi:hypothetical protein
MMDPDPGGGMYRAAVGFCLACLFLPAVERTERSAPPGYESRRELLAARLNQPGQPAKASKERSDRNTGAGVGDPVLAALMVMLFGYAAWRLWPPSET